MIYAVVASFTSFLSMLMFLPLSLAINCHFSLGRELGLITVSKMRLDFVKIKIFTENDKVKVKVNGKSGNPLDLKRMKLSGSVFKLIKFALNERLLTLVYALGLIGGEDAADCALRIGIIRTFFAVSGLAENNDKKSQDNYVGKDKTAKINVIPDYDSDRLDFCLNTELKMNIIQFIKLGVMLLKK